MIPPKAQSCDVNPVKSFMSTFSFGKLMLLNIYVTCNNVLLLFTVTEFQAFKTDVFNSDLWKTINKITPESVPNLVFFDNFMLIRELK